jgi:hypothetical protein
VTPAERLLWEALKRALLAMVAAIDRYLDEPKRPT